MPTPPYAKLLVQVNAGALQSGAIYPSVGDTILLSGESVAFWQQQRFEVYDFPEGFAVPAGWTDAGNGTYFYATDPYPPAFTVTPWGKFMLRLVVNRGLNGAGKLDQGLTDASTALSIPSTNLALSDLGFLESNQFNTEREWTGDDKANLRILDTFAGTVPSGLSSATPQAVGTSGSAGASTLASRGDHRHALSFATVQSVLAGASGALAVNGQKITGLGSPTPASSDAATALYAESVVTFARVNVALASANASVGINGQALVNVSHVDFAASGVSATGLLRATTAAQTAVAQKSSISGAHDVAALAFDGADGVVLGGLYAASLLYKAPIHTIADASGTALLTIDEANGRVELALDVFRWDESSSPAITQKQPTGSANGHDFIIAAQDGGSGGGGIGGSLILVGGRNSGGGVWDGNVVIGDLNGATAQDGQAGRALLICGHGVRVPTVAMPNVWQAYPNTSTGRWRVLRPDGVTVSLDRTLAFSAPLVDTGVNGDVALAISAASGGAAGTMSATDFTKLSTYAATPAGLSIAASQLTGAVAVSNGGTGVTSWTIGDLLIATAPTTIGPISDVATGEVLVSGGVGVAPAWSSSLTLAGALSVAAGITNFTSLAPVSGSKPTISGSRQGNPGLASLLSGLSTLGLLTDSSTAGVAPPSRGAPPAPGPRRSLPTSRSPLRLLRAGGSRSLRSRSRSP